MQGVPRRPEPGHPVGLHPRTMPGEHSMLFLIRKFRGDAVALPPRASLRQIALAWLGGALAIGCCLLYTSPSPRD